MHAHTHDRLSLTLRISLFLSGIKGSGYWNSHQFGLSKWPDDSLLEKKENLNFACLREQYI